MKEGKILLYNSSDNGYKVKYINKPKIIVDIEIYRIKNLFLFRFQ